MLGVHPTQFIFRRYKYESMKKLLYLNTVGLVILLTFSGLKLGTPLYQNLSSTKTKSFPDDSDKVVAIGHMSIPRAAHTSTLLQNGQILVTGGCIDQGCEIRSAKSEIYDPASKSFTTIQDMIKARVSHTATLLPNGKVLIAGGWTPTGVTGDAELYDPETQSFESTGNMNTPRGGHTAILLNHGSVLIAGGGNSQGEMSFSEIYDPKKGRFIETGSMQMARGAHIAVLLKDGRVLVAGGRNKQDQVLASAEIFDPKTRTFVRIGNMTIVRHKHAGIALSDGRILIVGGSNADDWNGKYQSAEVFNPKTGQFSSISNMERERFKLRNAVAALKSGEIVIAGGNKYVEIYNSINQTFRVSKGRLDTGRMFSTATSTFAGGVLIAGGYDDSLRPTDKVWLYRR